MRYGSETDDRMLPTWRDNDIPDGNIDADVRIGHVHVKVADLSRALDFYCEVLGFDLMQRYGDEVAFVSARGYHHHIALNTWESSGGVLLHRDRRGFSI